MKKQVINNAVKQQTRRWKQYFNTWQCVEEKVMSNTVKPYVSPEEKKAIEEKPLTLKLIPYGTDEVKVIAVNDKGESVDHGTLMIIGKKGVYRCEDFNEGFGVRLNDNGQIFDRGSD